MNGRIEIAALWGVSLLVVLSGCSREPDVNSELAKATAALEQPATVQPQPTTPGSAATQPPPAPTPTPAPAQQMKQALAAYKSGDLQDAVTRLQRLRATPAMTPQQRIALNDAMAAVMSEIYSLAASGNTRAIQAVKQYEQMQTQAR